MPLSAVSTTPGGTATRAWRSSQPPHAVAGLADASLQRRAPRLVGHRPGSAGLQQEQVGGAEAEVQDADGARGRGVHEGPDGLGEDARATDLDPMLPPPLSTRTEPRRPANCSRYAWRCCRWR